MTWNQAQRKKTLLVVPEPAEAKHDAADKEMEALPAALPMHVASKWMLRVASVMAYR